MPGWQQFWQAEAGTPNGWRFIAVAVDAAGPEAARPFYEAAKATFTAFVDPENRLGGALGAQRVPNGLLVDNGRIVWAKIGGFSIDNPEDVDMVRAWLERGTLPDAAPLLTHPLKAELQSAYLKLAGLHRAQGDIPQALGELRRALALDPENFIVRKQIWSIEHPERFYPAIDKDWQTRQLAEERTREAAACGPGGCAIPETR